MNQDCAESAGPPVVTIEFFGIPRQRAGRAELTVTAATAGAALAEVERQCPRLAGLRREDGGPAPQYLLSLNGGQFVSDPEHSLRDGDRLLLLSADVGG